ncbi:MAG: hypothetical protein PVH66_05780, partial [Methyloceanibacter sp.]
MADHLSRIGTLAAKGPEMIAIGVPAEGSDEPRIGITPETVKKLVKAGAKVSVRSGAGLRSHFTDNDYTEAGASIAKS